jgi:hypothetical protein
VGPAAVSPGVTMLLAGDEAPRPPALTAATVNLLYVECIVVLLHFGREIIIIIIIIITFYVNEAPRPPALTAATVKL